MAKIIGVTPGTRVTVGHTTVKVIRIHEGAVTLQVDNGPRFIVTDSERTELGPDTYVSLGYNPSQQTSTHMARLAFEAPRSVLIDRVREHALPA